MIKRGYVQSLVEKFLTSEESMVAFSLYDGKQVTNISYPQFARDVLKAAGYFSEHKITKQHIAIAAPNSYYWVVTLFAIMASGNVAVPLNQALPEELLQWQCEKADITMVCHDNSETADKLSKVIGLPFDVIKADVGLRMGEIYSHDAEETVLMMFTSGTTGMSKAVMLSEKNLVASFSNLFYNRNQLDEIKPCEEKYILSLPLYHIGSIRFLISQLDRGAVIAIGRGTQYLFADLPKLNPTHIGMVPAMVESFAKIIRRTPLERWKDYIGNNFKRILAVGAAMKPTVARELLEKNIQIDVIFGMTESAGDGSWCLLDENHLGTIGKPDGNIAFRIVDGEILLKSDGVMKGYYKDSDETAKVIVDGWLHTGDMGYCDEDGYYYITGRKKNVIILSNGENVNPEEIEATFGACAAIEECLVYSDGKGICGDVYTSDRDSAAAFIKAYNESMPMYRQVYKITYTDEPLPKTGSGKIKRKENK